MGAKPGNPHCKKDRGKKDRGKKDRGKKDRGKKDRGKKDRGKKDRGKKDRGKKDRGKKDRDNGAFDVRNAGGSSIPKVTPALASPMRRQSETTPAL